MNINVIFTLDILQLDSSLPDLKWRRIY